MFFGIKAQRTLRLYSKTEETKKAAGLEMKKLSVLIKEAGGKKGILAALKKIGLRFRNYILDTDEMLPGQKIRWKRVFGLSSLIAFLFALPAIVTNVIFDWIPMFDGIIKAFCYVDRSGESYFIGLENFKNVFTDPILYKSIGNMLFFFVFNLILMFPTIICTVVMFRMKSAKVQYVYRVLLCLPMVVPSLVFTLLWIFVFGYNFGVMTDLAEKIFGERYNFLGDPDLIKWTILFTGIPWVTSNNVLIYIGGLNGISESVWDAAKLDGVGPIKKFFSLELPLIVGQFKLVLIGVLGASITTYSTQLMYYNAAVHDAVMTPGLLMYFKAFPLTTVPADYGYSYALGLVLFVVSLTLSLLSMKFVKSADY